MIVLLRTRLIVRNVKSFHIHWSSEAVDLCLNSTKIPKDLKQEVKNISCAIMEVEEINEDKIVSSLNVFSIFEHVKPKQMAGRATKRSNSQAGVPTSHSRWKSKNIGYSQNKIKVLWKNTCSSSIGWLWKRLFTSIIHPQWCRISSDGPSL